MRKDNSLLGSRPWRRKRSLGLLEKLVIILLAVVFTAFAAALALWVLGEILSFGLVAWQDVAEMLGRG